MADPSDPDELTWEQMPTAASWPEPKDGYLLPPPLASLDSGRVGAGCAPGRGVTDAAPDRQGPDHDHH